MLQSEGRTSLENLGFYSQGLQLVGRGPLMLAKSSPLLSVNTSTAAPRLVTD